MKLVKINNHIFEYDGRNYNYKSKEVMYLNIDYIVEIKESNITYPSKLYEVILRNGSKLRISKEELNAIVNNN